MVPSRILIKNEQKVAKMNVETQEIKEKYTENIFTAFKTGNVSSGDPNNAATANNGPNSISIISKGVITVPVHNQPDGLTSFDPSSLPNGFQSKV